jgi:serine/threonine protein kinase/tetratricopeptide (TPR) repeat protein
MDPELTPPPDAPPPSADDTVATLPSDEGGGAAHTGDPSLDELEDPTRIGRFVVIERLGAGGMGVVYAAFDPKLERKIAVKLVRPRRGSDQKDAQTRLLREAQAMAKLSDPNVIQVFDVGTHGEQVYIAMEFVKGTTLRRWLTRGVFGTRKREEVLDVFARAGKGLAAAHAAGLVHRDFKPDNVLVGSDGRVRVSDFGLVRAGEEETVPIDVRRTLEKTGAHVALGQEGLGVSLTQTGAMMGTPAYMAPEQFAGGEVDARTDQFAYCVSLWEALYGERPFAGKTPIELVYAVSQGELRAPPVGVTVPARLRKILSRGLSLDPGERYPSMNALLSELIVTPTQRGSRLLLGAVAVGVLGTGSWILTHQPEPTPDLRCTGFEEKLAGVWDAGRRDQVQSAILGTEVAFAGTVSETVTSVLDTFGQDWVAMRSDACEATQIRGEQSTALMDLRMACLDRQLGQVDALVEVLAQADAKTVSNGVRAVRSLEPLSVCADTHALTAQVPLPSEPGRAQRAKEVEKAIAHVTALYLAGQYDKGLEAAQQTDADAASLGHAPLEAHAAYAHASLLASTGKFAEADPFFRKGYWKALASGNDKIMARASASAAWNLGANLRKDDIADDWIENANASIERWGTGTEEHARWLTQLALIRGKRGEHEESFKLHHQSMEVRTEALGPDSFMLGVDHLNLGVAYHRVGDYASARQEMTRALAILEPAVGSEHPWVNILQQNLSQLHLTLGNLAKAREHAERALESRKKTLGEEHPQTAASHSALANILNEHGDLEEARTHIDRALVIKEKAYGADNPEVGQLLVTLASIRAKLGEVEEARADLGRARGIFHKANGEDLHFGDALSAEASILRESGDPKGALALHDRAISVFEKTLGDEHPYVGRTSFYRALTLGQLGRFADGARSAERAMAIHQKSKQVLEEARAQYALAYLLDAMGEPEARSQGPRNAAREVFGERGEGGARHRTRIDEWAKTLPKSD